MTEGEKARKEIDRVQEDARNQLAAMTAQSFEMDSETTDKNGELTRVLIIDTDCDEVLGMYFEQGNPFEFDGTDVPREDKALTTRYLHKMANVDLAKPSVQRAVGFQAAGQARTLVRNFFIARAVSEIRLIDAPARPEPL
jgi:hypothetical protein